MEWEKEGGRKIEQRSERRKEGCKKKKKEKQEKMGPNKGTKIFERTRL